jgi:hypothetical protein
MIEDTSSGRGQVLRAIMRASAVSAGKGCTRIVIDNLDLLSPIGLPQSP